MLFEWHNMTRGWKWKYAHSSLTVLIQREKDGIERELRERADVRNEGN